jgi:hypothetical protein
MPAIADPYSTHPHPAVVIDADDHGPSLKTRARVALHRSELTRALADGAEPGFSEELYLHASRLTSEPERKSLARSLRRVLAEARRAPVGRYRGLIRRGAVFDAEDAIRAMIDRVSGPEPVRSQGMAMTEMILTNADNGPLYNSTAPARLRDEILAATAAMETDLTRSHEFPVGV